MIAAVIILWLLLALFCAAKTLVDVRAERDYWLTRARAAELHRDLMRRHADAIERKWRIAELNVASERRINKSLEALIDDDGESWKRGG